MHSMQKPASEADNLKEKHCLVFLQLAKFNKYILVLDYKFIKS